MSYADNNYEKSYVVTYKELIFTFLVFSVILFVLFPKDLLKEQILAENSNYDLSMLYLKNLLQHSPKDESLMLILAEQSLRSGKKDLSIRLLDLLLNSKNRVYRSKATLLSYELKKEDYYYLKNYEAQKRQKKELRTLFFKIYLQKMYDETEIQRWHDESLFVGNSSSTYFFTQELLKKDKKNIALLEEAYYLSIKLHKPKDSLMYIRLLSKYDASRANEWLFDEYNMYVNYREYDKAELLLKKHAKPSSVKWRTRLADFYLMRKSFAKASDIYIDLFNDSDNYKTKRHYFYKATGALQAGSLFSNAAHLARKYEGYYLNDKSARQYILKLYISTGNLEYASSLSKKILRKKYRL
jgi:hypothetical protein